MSNSDAIAIASELRTLKAGIAMSMPNNPALAGWSAYAQCDEDGIIRECLERISANCPLSNTFVEIGCADGLENNSHLLILDGYRGVWVDGSGDKISDIGKALGGTTFEHLWALEAMVSLETSSSIAERARSFLGEDSIDFFSLDIDGNDWHVLPSFLELLKPKLVCVEYNAKFPPPTRLVMQYSANHTWKNDDFFGASLQSWVDVLSAHDYSLVCCNLSGANAFFVKNDLLPGFTTYKVSDLYQPARYNLVNATKGHAPSLKWSAETINDAPSASVRFVTTHALNSSFPFGIHTGTDQFISGDLARDGVWEPFETQVFSRLCKPGDSVLDLGANIGWYSTIAAKILGNNGSILAFEPDETNARLLEMNLAISDVHNIAKVVRAAVADKEANALFYKSDFNLGDHRLFSDGSSREVNSVPVTTLDIIFNGNNAKLPDIVKSDTQGSEAKILKGASKLFKNGWRPIMILEFWPFGLSQSGDNPLELWEKLVALEYSIYELSETTPVLKRLTKVLLNERLNGDISPAAQGFINLCCIPANSERLSGISDLIL
jgi:FkbM family methyltransferase